MKKYRLQTIVLAATMVLSGIAVAQQEVAPDHFDQTPTIARQARFAKVKPSANRKTVTTKSQPRTHKGENREMALAGK